jgi:hypothetical protein
VAECCEWGNEPPVLINWGVFWANWGPISFPRKTLLHRASALTKNGLHRVVFSIFLHCTGSEDRCRRLNSNEDCQQYAVPCNITHSSCNSPHVSSMYLTPHNHILNNSIWLTVFYIHRYNFNYSTIHFNQKPHNF